MFISSEIGIPKINVGESSVIGTGEATIHVQQEKLERCLYKNVDFVNGQ
jgi:hypothetical protein